MNIIINIISILALFIASYIDMKTHEVPDWLNFALIGIGVFFGAISSVFLKSFIPLLASIIGLGIGFLLGALMFYTNQWGGGDAKMLMGLGALIGLDVFAIIKTPQIPIIITLFISILICGAIYGLFYAIYLLIKNFKAFKKEFKEYAHTKSIIRVRIISILILICGIIIGLLIPVWTIKMIVIILSCAIFVLTYAVIIAKIIEKSCLIKEIPPNKLTEGDWVKDSVLLKGKVIYDPKKDNGISRENILLLKKLKIKTVIVKEGIPFIPGFLLGYIMIVMLGNWVQTIISFIF